MTTYNFTGIADAVDNIRRWIFQNDADLPAHLTSRLRGLSSMGSSPVDTAAIFVGMVYANQDLFNQDAKDIASAAAIVCETYNFHGMASDHRGSLISQVLAGDTVPEDQIPEPDSSYAPPPPPDTTATEQPVA